MWNGKKKAVTFSYDDGIEQDIRLVNLLNEYGMKATFNLNSGIQTRASVFREEKSGILVRRMNQRNLKQLYAGHEIASHGLTHADLTQQDEETVYNEIFADKRNLESMFEQEVVGYAYPFGNCNGLTDQIVKDCGFQYARTVECSGNFGFPGNLFRLKASFHHNTDGILGKIEEFLEKEAETPMLLLIWGHSYEFDVWNNWDHIEKIIRRLAGRKEIYYGTNREVLLGGISL